jgi:hypothetical protein
MPQYWAASYGDIWSIQDSEHATGERLCNAARSDGTWGAIQSYNPNDSGYADEVLGYAAETQISYSSSNSGGNKPPPQQNNPPPASSSNRLPDGISYATIQTGDEVYVAGRTFTYDGGDKWNGDGVQVALPDGRGAYYIGKQVVIFNFNAKTDYIKVSR